MHNEESPCRPMDEHHGGRARERLRPPSHASASALARSPRGGDEARRTEAPLIRPPRARVAPRAGALAALLVAAVMLGGCLAPIYDDSPRECVAFHDCNTCDRNPCVSAYGCINRQCVPIDMPTGSSCTQDGERGLCFAGECLIVSYPDAPAVVVSDPSTSSAPPVSNSRATFDPNAPKGGSHEP